MFLEQRPGRLFLDKVTIDTILGPFKLPFQHLEFTHKRGLDYVFGTL